MQDAVWGYSGNSAARPAAFDDRDAAIADEAAQGRLALLAKDQTQRTGSANVGDVLWTAFTGEHTAETLRTYRVHAADGLEWTYLQPYSRLGQRQIPGEHRFVLRGALAGPVEVQPPSNKWRKPMFGVGLALVCTIFAAFYGFGLVLGAIFLFAYPVRARYKSPDPRLAKWVAAQPGVKRAVRATRWGWLGPLGTQGWKLAWVIRLEPRANGTSLLTVKAPDVGRWDFGKWKVGFSQAETLARELQGILVAPGR